MSYRKYKWKLALHKNYESAFVTQLSRALNSPTRICKFVLSWPIRLVPWTSRYCGRCPYPSGRIPLLFRVSAFYSVETKSVNTVVYLLCRVSLSSTSSASHARCMQIYHKRSVCIKNEEFIKNKESEDGQIIKKRTLNTKICFCLSSHLYSI